MRKLLSTSRTLFDMSCCPTRLEGRNFGMFDESIGVKPELNFMTMTAVTAPATCAEESIESESTLHSGTRPKDWDDWDSRAC